MIENDQTVEELQAEVARLRERTTALEQQVEQHRLAEDHHRLILESAPAPIVLYDTVGQVRYLNPAFEKSFGWSLDELVGKRIDFVPEANLPETRRAIAQGFSSPDIVQFESRRYTKDRRVLDVQISAAVYHDRENKPVGMTVMLNDITERKRAERELRTFQALAENAPDGIALVGEQANIMYANQSFRTMTGYGDELLNMTISACFAPDEPLGVEQLASAVATGGSWQGILTYRRRDGSQFKAQQSIFPIHAPDGQLQGFAGICRDITAQLRNEEERRALQEQVIAAQRAALLELSTPLIPISDAVMVMPLIGSIDSARARQILEKLLEGTVAGGAAAVIVDITGVPVVDTHVAGVLIQSAQALRLVGAQVVLTGIRPEVAQTLIGIGVDLTGIATRSTLQSGITYALARSHQS